MTRKASELSKPKDQKPYIPAHPQEQAHIKPVTIKELVTDRDVYENYPPYQRRKVWPTKYDQWLINDILAGKSIPSLIAYKEMDENGKQTYWVTDGHQRLSAIYDFTDNKFRTWTHAQKENAHPNSSPPIEPRKYFKDLSVQAKNIFLAYVVYIAVESKDSDTEQRERFRSSQVHVPLTAAEKIGTYVSKAKDAATVIEKHVFWDEFYLGKEQYRKKIFQSSLYLLAIEMSSDGLADVSATDFIHALASGKRDENISDEIVDAVIARLDVVCHVFRGTQFTVRSTAIVMYQAVMFLEKAGVVVQAKDQGRLSNWIHTVITESKHTEGVIGYQRPLNQVVRKAMQKAFWEKHLKTVLGLFEAN